MAAETLRYQSSTAYCGSTNSGYLRSMFHFLDFDRHLNKKKMLSHKRHGGEKHKEGRKTLTSQLDPISSDQGHVLDKDAKLQMENKVDARKKGSVSVRLIALLYKKLTGKHHRKLKNSSSSAQLLRTFSIHHLECDDYVLLDSDPTDKNSTSVPNSSEESLQDAVAMASGNRENDKTEINPAANLEQRINDIIKEEQRISMDGVLDKIPFGHKLDDIQTENSRGRDGPTTKFGSEGFLHTNSKIAQRSMQRSCSLTESLDIFTDLLESSSSSSSVKESHGLHQRSNSVKVQQNRRILRSRSLSESLDRYLHLLEFISVKESQRPQKLNSVSELDNNSARRRALRSHSLSESFDRYHLLESISVREPMLPQRSTSVKDQGNNLEQRRVLHSRSLSESSDTDSRLLESSIRDPKRKHERLESIRDDDVLEDMKPEMACLGIVTNVETGAFSPCKEVPSTVSTLLSDLSSGKAKLDTCPSDEPITSHMECVQAGEYVKDNVKSNSNRLVGGLQQSKLIIEHGQNEAWSTLDDLTADDSDYTLQDENAKENKEDPCLKASPNSVLDSCLKEDPVSPVKHVESQGAESQYSRIQSDQQNSDSYPVNSLDDAVFRTVILNETDSENKQMTVYNGHDNMNSSHAAEKEEFHYVKNVLKKSEFCEGAEEFLTAWRSSYEPVDQLLFVEEPETMRDDSSEVPIDFQLLLDLVNEVLLGIYGNVVACNTGLSRFCPRIRPVPFGDHLIHDVWEKVSWHLSTQEDMVNSHTLEQVEARDYAENDRWMNLQWDAERVVIYLQGLMLDDLVDEIIKDFDIA